MKIVLMLALLQTITSTWAIEMGKPSQRHKIPTLKQDTMTCSWINGRILQINPPGQSTIYLCQGNINCGGHRHEVGCLATASGDCPSADYCANSSDVSVLK